MTGKPSHFEIGVADVERAQKFYGELFGWGFEGADHGARVRTTGIPGGLHRQDDGASIQIFYAVPDLNEAAKKVVELGGKIGEGQEEGSEGRWLFACWDDQGVPFGLHEPLGD